MAELSARTAGLSTRARLLALFALGVIAGLGQAPLDWWPATVLALACAFLLNRDCATARRAGLGAWCLGLGYFGFSLRWIVEPFLVDIARHGWMAPFALVLMAGGAGLFWALAGYIAHRLAPGRILAFGLWLVAAEVIRSLIFTGFPWALLGHIWVSTALSQLAAMGGPHLLSLLTVLAAWALALVILRIWAGAVVLAVMGAIAFFLKPDDAPALVGDAPVVRLVQPNAPQHQKWDPAYRDLFFQRLVDFTREGPVPDLVVWPETAIPSLLNYIEDDLSVLTEAARGAPVIFGIQRRDDAGRYYNSFVVMSGDGQIDGRYDKSHLVPFGEYIPGGQLAARLGLQGLAATVGGGFTAGPRGGTLDVPGIGPAIPLICYEGIFAEEVRRAGERPRLMVLITNDAWFGQAAGPYQHLAQARLRAIEQGLPMVRVANTGVTAMIDAKGRVSARIPLGTDGAIDALLPEALPPTLYARFGDNPFLLLLILLISGYSIRGRRVSD